MKLAFESSKCGCDLKMLVQNTLTSLGVLEVSIVVDDRGTKRCVFIYHRAGAEESAKFKTTKVLLAQRGEAEPVYYAPTPLPETTAKVNPCKPLEGDQFNPWKDPTPGEYVTWWSSREEPTFSGTKTQKRMLASYKALRGINSIVLAAILKESGFYPDPELGRATLDEETAVFHLKGPEDQPIILTANIEKGLRFHFSKHTPVYYRKYFHKAFLKYAKEWRKWVIERNIPLDPPDPEHDPYRWFKALCDVTADTERNQGEVDVIGLVNI